MRLGRLDLFAVVATMAFMGVTGFDVVVHGLLEPSTVMPEHANARAASPLLPLRAILAVVAGASGSTALFRATGRRRILRPAFLGLAIVSVLVWSACGIERSAPSYSERAFMEFIDDAVYARGALTKQDAFRRLAPPLVAGSPFEGIECWSYTYMPTAGLGWSKRMLFFDRSGKLVSWDIVDEP